MDGINCHLDILDTAGQEEYSAMRDQYMRGGEGFLLVFDVSSKVSFNELQAFLNQVWQVKDSKEVPILIVGNKVDLQQRAVSVEDATSFAKSHSLEYMDVSAKTNYNVTEAFSAVVRKIHVQHCKTNPQRKKSRAKCALM